MGSRILLVFDNLNMNLSIDSAILVVNDCLAQIYLKEGTNNIINLSNVDQSKYQDTYHNSVIFSRNNLCFKGKGKLTINSDKETSIESEDSVTFISGNYKLNTKGDGIKAENQLLFRSGDVFIKSGDDALKTESDKFKWH